MKVVSILKFTSSPDGKDYLFEKLTPNCGIMVSHPCSTHS